MSSLDFFLIIISFSPAFVFIIAILLEEHFNACTSCFAFSFRQDIDRWQEFGRHAFLLESWHR
jgi:hypothetical protein